MSIKAKCPEFENHERWLLPYADMLTLLFAVFVVLYSLALSSKKDEQKAVAASIQESFNTPMPDIPIDRRIGPEEQGIGIFEHFKGQSIKPSLIEKYPSSSIKVKTIDNEMNQVKMKLEERLYGKNKFRDDTKAGQERIVQVTRTAKGFKLQLLAPPLFPARLGNDQPRCSPRTRSSSGSLKRTRSTGEYPGPHRLRACSRRTR